MFKQSRLMSLVVVFGLLFLAIKQLFLKSVPKFLESYDLRSEERRVGKECVP